MNLAHIVLVVMLCGLPLRGSAQDALDPYRTNHDFFDLACRHDPANDQALAFHVEVSSLGEFSVRAAREAPGTERPARTYTNAVTWEDGSARYALDRSSGVLKVSPSGERYVCERVGGRKF